MAVPKQKTSKSRRDMRRSHLALRVNNAIESCTNCGEPKLRHRVCMKCGYFRGRNVLNLNAA
ncbi:MAG: 50S ribosomal protein L32 [Myxococcota bacterium]